MRKAVAVLRGNICNNPQCTKCESILGKVYFCQKSINDSSEVYAEFYDLPKGLHGFHIHEFGDTTDGCISAGAHFNPFGKNHGGLRSKERHIGDMGNVPSYGDHITKFAIDDDTISLFGDFSVVGRSCVIHENEDDLGLGDFDDSKTTGHSGPRLACGVIGWCK